MFRIEKTGQINIYSPKYRKYIINSKHMEYNERFDVFSLILSLTWNSNADTDREKT